jgi:hypothetical protein
MLVIHMQSVFSEVDYKLNLIVLFTYRFQFIHFM